MTAQPNPTPPVVPSAVRTDSIVRSERLQLVLAGLFWGAGAVALSWRGMQWLLPLQWWPLFALAGVGLGVLKARYILRPVARKVAVRIYARGPGAPIAGFLSVRSWVTVVVMMAAGHSLRLTAVPRPALGVLYVGIASALLIASTVFWRSHALGWGRIDPLDPHR